MRLSKSDLDYFVSAKPRTAARPGYFKDSGELVRGPFYEACLGKRTVGYPIGTYRSECGMYLLRSDALEGAKLFQAKMREMLASGEYENE